MCSNGCARDTLVQGRAGSPQGWRLSSNTPGAVRAPTALHSEICRLDFEICRLVTRLVRALFIRKRRIDHRQPGRAYVKTRSLIVALLFVARAFAAESDRAGLTPGSLPDSWLTGGPD